MIRTKSSINGESFTHFEDTFINSGRISAESPIIVSDVANGNGFIGVFYGYGDGNFAVLKTYAAAFNSNPTSIAIRDFNRDNRLDLAINYPNKAGICIMLRLKSESFATPTLCSTGDYSYPKSVSIGDFNSDDQQDIAVANFGTNNIGIFLGNGNGTFAQQQTYSTGDNSEPVSNALGDFNNDNYLDVVVANVLVFLGSNNGTFLKPKLYALGYNAHPQSVAIGDINNDHLYDIVVANYGTDYVQILLQTC